MTIKKEIISNNNISLKNIELQNSWDRNGSMGDKTSAGGPGGLAGGAILSTVYQKNISSATTIINKNNNQILKLKSQKSTLETNNIK